MPRHSNTRIERHKIKKNKMLKKIKIITTTCFFCSCIFGASFFYLKYNKTKPCTTSTSKNKILTISPNVNNKNSTVYAGKTTSSKNNNKINKTTISGSNNKTNKTTNLKLATTSINFKYAVDANNALKSDGKKVAFLTFDDGPTPNITPEVLQILDENNVKATFFVIGYLAKDNPNLIKEEFSKGHAIANHTYSHNYKALYSSTKDFMSDVNMCNDTLKNILGKNFTTKLVRFPGGCYGKKMIPYVDTLHSDGYSNIDWNALSKDAEGHNIRPEKLLQNVKETTSGKDHVVILMHDAATKKTTVEALPSIIQYLKSQGYEFKVLR